MELNRYLSDASRHPSLPGTFSDLMEVATSEKWCTKVFCTTCGAMPFRKALRQIQRPEVIRGLRALDSEFLHKNNEMFRLIVMEISLLPTGWDLLETLDGTPAAEQLRANITYQNERNAARLAYEASQDPAAVAKRREEKKAERLKATEIHREKKSASEPGIREALQKLEYVEDAQLLEKITDGNFSTTMEAISGIFYKRLLSHYRSVGVAAADMERLGALASNHGGYWAKLLAKTDAFQP